MRYHFAGYTLDAERFELSRDGTVLPLQRQALRLLRLLLEGDGRLVTKDRLIETIWAGRVVSDSAITSQVKALRKAMGDTERPHRIIGTVHGEGFRILAPVEMDRDTEIAMQGDGQEEGPTSTGAPPKIAVLPFRQIGSVREHLPLCEALPDEIINALSRLRWMQVIARGSSFRFPPLSSDLATIRDKLGADYVVIGSIELVLDYLMVRVSLEDTRDETVVWSERFRIAPEGIHEIREEMVARTVSAIEFHTPLHEMERTRLVMPDKLSAWEAYHRGISNVFTFGTPNYATAIDCFRRAVAIEPKFARAHAGISHVNWWQLVQQNQDIGERARKEMFEAAEKAMQADPFDPFANLVRGRAAWLTGDADWALSWFERSIGQSPNFAMAQGAIANLHALRGNAEAALPHVDKAIQLSPLDPWLHNFYAIRGAAHIVRGEFAEGVEWSDKAMALPHDSLIVVQLAFLANHLAGNKERAAALAKRLKRCNPHADTRQAMRAVPVYSPEFLQWMEEAFGAYDLN